MLTGARHFVDKVNDGYYLEHYLRPLYRQFAMFFFALLMFLFAVASGVTLLTKDWQVVPFNFVLAVVSILLLALLPFVFALKARGLICSVFAAYMGKDREEVAATLRSYGWMAIGIAYAALGFVISDFQMILRR